jgi:uncharacterized membrane protein (UPF0182 family)
MAGMEKVRVAAVHRPVRRWPLVAAGIVFVLVWTASGLARFFLNLLWFREVGKTQVFWGVLGAEVGLGVVTGLGTAVIVGGNLWVAERISVAAGLRPVEEPGVESLRGTLVPHLRWLRLGAVAVLGLLVGLHGAGQWRTYLLWRNQVPFGDTDAQFGRDIGFYVFSLPLQRALFGWLLFTLLVTTLLVVAEHWLLGGIQPAATGNRVAPHVQAHLSLLLGCILLLKAWGYRLDQWSLVFSPRGVVTGASYTDVHAQLPALRLLMVVALGCALLFFLNVRSRDFTLPVVGTLLFGLSSVLIGGLVPTFVQRFQVTPQELQREEPYIQRNIDATRKAFALEAVETTEFPASDDLTPAAVRANTATVDNIRLWEAAVLKTAIQNLQAIGQYYEFSDVDVDRYRIGGAPRQVMISAREVDPRNLDASAQTWVNLQLAYTHGYGVVAAQVNRAETSGRPAFVVSGFDQQQAAIPVRQPRIYFGEPPPDTPAYVVVSSRQPEVGSPSVSGQGQASFRYDGHGGVQLSSPLRRLAAALHFTDLNLLISSNLNARSRILFNRDIRDRMEKAAPFLQWDADPYVAVVDGRVLFIRDGYTTTDNYPYSQRIPLDVAARRTEPEDRGVHGEANYIRNSVKAVVDAYDGTTTLYAFDESDPLLQAWRKAFPDLFAPRSALSRELQAHLRYPEDLFSIQTDRYASYHLGAARDFYSKQDFWALPEDRSGQLTHGQGSLVVAGPKPRMRPYYLLTRLPGERDEQFVLVMPFTPNNKQNMVAYMAARSDPSGYGRITLFSLPRSRTVLGPTQVHAQILADPEVSKELTLFNQQGSTVILGNLLTVPIEDSLLYVQPIFVQASQGAIPELRRVPVFFNNQLGYTASLADSIDQVLDRTSKGPSADSPQPPAGPQATSTALAQILQQQAAEYRRAQQALDRNDLGAYQQAVERLGQLIQQAQQLTGAPPSPTTAQATSPP